MFDFESVAITDAESANLKRSGAYVRARKRDANRSGGTRLVDRPFVSWDGEGEGDGKERPQDYIVIGNSEGGILSVGAGYLPSLEVFEFLLRESHRLWDYIHVAFGFNYDVNQILRDVPFPVLRKIRADNVAHWRGYRLEWFPGKWFALSNRKSQRSFRVYDTIGFWHTSLLKALEAEPKLANDPRLALIREGKQDRGTFSRDELDTKVIPYFRAEMEMHSALCEHLRETLAEVNIPYGGRNGNLLPNEWYGPSAIVKTLYSRAHLKDAMNRPISDATRPRRIKHGRTQVPDKRIRYSLPDEVNEAARAAFAGGRFEQFKIGFHDGPVYGYDITSAYPHAQTKLPQLAYGEWRLEDRAGLEVARKTLPRPPWGFYWLYADAERYSNDVREYRNAPPGVPPYPLFNRDRFGTVSYPPYTAGWYPAYSADLLWRYPNVEFQKAWIWTPDRDAPIPLQPFADPAMVDFNIMFKMRDHYGSRGRDDLKYAMKITLNSGYGKTAQKTGVGEGDNLPAFHQIEWASHITDHCRAKIYRAALAAWKIGALVSIETDAIYTTKPIPAIDKQCRAGLGYWKREEYSGIVYLQSGVYFTRSQSGEWSFHNRGLDRDSLDAETVRKHLSAIPFHADIWPSIFGRLSNFAGMGQAGISVVTHPTQFYQQWLKWPSKPKEIRLGHPAMKRGHFPANCKACIEGIPPSEEMHDLTVPPWKGGTSIPKKYAWILQEEAAEFQDALEEKWS